MKKGFTLIELLLVVSLIGILLSFALPAYQHYLERSYRTGAISMLAAAATCQERHRASTGSYDTTRCNSLGDNHHYQLLIEPEGETSSPGFTLIAKPLVKRKSDYCGSLILDQSGLRSISGADKNRWKCWSGR